MDLYWQKILQILGVTKEEFTEEPYVYGTAALILLFVILSVNRLFASVWSKCWGLFRTIFRIIGKFISETMQKIRVHFRSDAKGENHSKVRNGRVSSPLSRGTGKITSSIKGRQSKKKTSARYRAK